MCTCVHGDMHAFTVYSDYSSLQLFSLGCDIQFAGSHFFEGSQFSVSGLSLAFYSGLYAYDGWYVL